MTAYYHYVRSAHKDYSEEGIKKGDRYWWKMLSGNRKIRYKEKPAPSTTLRRLP